jgi:hypothetical protein
VNRYRDIYGKDSTLKERAVLDNKSVIIENDSATSSEVSVFEKSAVNKKSFEIENSCLDEIVVEFDLDNDMDGFFCVFKSVSLVYFGICW